MQNRTEFYKKLKEEILTDSSNQGYEKILNSKNNNSTNKYTKLAQLINKNRSEKLGFPIIRTRTIMMVLDNIKECINTPQ